MSFWQRRAEKKNQKVIEKIQEEKKEVLANASSDEVRERVRAFTSVRMMVRKSLPLMVLGGILAFVEYELIGIVYTLVSLVVYVPLIYMYTRSVIPAGGKYLLHVRKGKGTMELTRYLIPDELFELIEFDAPLVPGMVRMNGLEAYLVTDVWKLENGVIWKAKLAFLHLNTLEYARSAHVLERATEFATNLAMQNSLLENLKELMGELSGQKNSKQKFELIDKAYRNDPIALARKIREMEQQIDNLMQRNSDLIFGPDDGEEKAETEEEVTER